MTEEQKKEILSLKWWHRIPITPGYTTPGICPHGHSGDFESRFGLPKDLTGLKILDVGGYDGLFSFECEKRGASKVDMIDYYQGSPNKNPNRPFQLAKEILNSNVLYQSSKLESYTPRLTTGKLIQYDLILYYGVMYHIENPTGAVAKLLRLAKPGGTILVETTISDPDLYNDTRALLQYKPGWEEDPTNQYYPNKKWIEEAFVQHGAKSVEVVYRDNIRATFRINC